MGDIRMDEQSTPTTNPAAGTGVLWSDTVLSMPFMFQDAPRKQGRSHRTTVANQAGFASDTYVTGSGILVPSFGVQAQTMLEWVISASKTAAGIAAPAYNFKVGVLQTTGDATFLTLTGSAQTAVVDRGILTLLMTCRSVGGTGVFQATACWNKNAAATGFASSDAGAVQGTSAGLNNSAFGGVFIGLSINGGASAAWTVTQVRADAIW